MCGNNLAMGSVLGVVLGGMDVSNDGWYTQRTEGIVQDGAGRCSLCVRAHTCMGVDPGIDLTLRASPNWTTVRLTARLSAPKRVKKQSFAEKHFETL